MKCNRKGCSNDEELAWPENWKKGMKPVNAETGKKHSCSLSMSINVDEIPESSCKEFCHECGSPVDYVCPKCGKIQVIDCK